MSRCDVRSFMLSFSSSLFQLLPGTQCTPGPERNASHIPNCSWLSWKANSWWMSSSPDSGGGSCPTVWTSATNKSRSGSKTAGWRRRDSCWESKRWPTFRDATEGDSIRSIYIKKSNLLCSLSMHALIYSFVLKLAGNYSICWYFIFRGTGCTSLPPKKRATKWLLKLYATCQDCRHVWYNRTSCEDVSSLKSASQLSPSTLHTTQNVKAIGLFRVKKKNVKKKTNFFFSF